MTGYALNGERYYCLLINGDAAQLLNGDTILLMID